MTLPTFNLIPNFFINFLTGRGWRVNQNYLLTYPLWACADSWERKKVCNKKFSQWATNFQLFILQIIVGVAPNDVITYVSKLYPESTSDKAIVQQSGLLNHLTAGDMVVADKGFLFQDILPNGDSVNIPPFLNNWTFTESETKATKATAKCRIHVEWANARLKDFRILSFIPSYLGCYAYILLQLCAALVNLQFPLIKEGCEDMVFE